MNLLACSTLACPRWSIDTVIQKAVEFGYQGIEWRGGREGHLPLGMSARELGSLRRKSLEAGLTALAVTTYTSFVSPVPEERNANVEELRRYSDLAAEIGASYVRAFLGELPAHANPDEALYENISECLHIAAAYAETVGVKIAVEPHDDFTRSSVVSRIFDRAGSGLRAVWDLGNTFAIGEDPIEGFRVLRDRLAYVQVKDGTVGEAGWQLCSVGRGEVPLERAFKLLSDSGYQGAISVEWEYAWHPELDPPEMALPAARRTVQKLLAAVKSESIWQ